MLAPRKSTCWKHLDLEERQRVVPAADDVEGDPLRGRREVERAPLEVNLPLCTFHCSARHEERCRSWDDVDLEGEPRR